MTKLLVAQVLNIEPDNILTAKEAAVMLGIQHPSVLKAISRDTLPATKAGSQWYLTVEDVEQYKVSRDGQTTDSTTNIVS